MGSLGGNVGDGNFHSESFCLEDARLLGCVWGRS